MSFSFCFSAFSLILYIFHHLIYFLCVCTGISFDLINFFAWSFVELYFGLLCSLTTCRCENVMIWLYIVGVFVRVAHATCWSASKNVLVFLPRVGRWIAHCGFSPQCEPGGAFQCLLCWFSGCWLTLVVSAWWVSLEDCGKFPCNFNNHAKLGNLFHASFYFCWIGFKQI